MTERDGVVFGSETSSSSNFLIQTPKILLDSAKILRRHKLTFFSIFALVTLPLAALQASIAVASRPTRARVAGLETLARVASTRFEARHVWLESRIDAVSLLYLKLILHAPSLALSLLASVAAVTAASAKHPTLRFSVAAVALTWKRPLLTSVLIHVLLLAYSHARQTFASAFPTQALIPAVGSAVEIYLIAVMSLAIVVSIAEEKLGFEAIRIGSVLMEGRRICGWVLSGLFALLTGSISRSFEKTAMAIDGQDVPQALASTAEILCGKVWLVALYGIVILFSYVVFTVFYCECCGGSSANSRKRYGNRSESEIEAISV